MNLLLSNTQNIISFGIIENWADNWMIPHCQDQLSGNKVVLDYRMFVILIYRVFHNNMNVLSTAPS